MDSWRPLATWALPPPKGQGHHPCATAVKYSKVIKKPETLCIPVNWICCWCKGVGSPVVSAAGAGGTLGDSHCKTGSRHQFSTKYTKKVTVFPELCFPRMAHRVTAEMFTQAISGASAGLRCIAVYIKHCWRKDKELSLHNSALRPHLGLLQPKLNTVVNNMEKYSREIHRTPEQRLKMHRFSSQGATQLQFPST